MKNYTKAVKERIARFLNSATSVVLHSYERYLSSDLPEDIEDESKSPEAFKKFHDAGKSAASHLESLLKLAHATHNSEEDEKDEEQLKRQNTQDAIQKAQQELDNY
jgi:tRNA C32,U32 (ribose-2'-O)-methylase TrmJ